ncbi:hypothetical protein HJG60_011908 [Phyllostomus discolor]|uniref:Uncharacterized protein n=1 Tax=Phyllostomus discolor TaxID=89673 RepID=A0A833ZE98_9CHIR|nr:hypothetical protein HJG60_011908 [Phyllostomus discolor]
MSGGVGKLCFMQRLKRLVGSTSRGSLSHLAAPEPRRTISCGLWAIALELRKFTNGAGVHRTSKNTTKAQGKKKEHKSCANTGNEELPTQSLQVFYGKKVQGLFFLNDQKKRYKHMYCDTRGRTDSCQSEKPLKAFKTGKNWVSGWAGHILWPLQVAIVCLPCCRLQSITHQKLFCGDPSASSPSELPHKE